MAFMIIVVLFCFAYFAFPFFGYPGYLGLPVYISIYFFLFLGRFYCSSYSHFWRIVFGAFFVLTLVLSILGMFFIYDFMHVCSEAAQACFYKLVLV
jgi:hypothetical protein